MPLAAENEGYVAANFAGQAVEDLETRAGSVSDTAVFGRA